MTVLIALAITIVIAGLVKAGFDYRLPGILLIPIYLALYWAIYRWQNPKAAAERAAEPDPDYSHWPISGPIGRLGKYGLLTTWYVTNALSAFNPFQLVQILKQVAGNTALEARAKKRGDGRDYETQAIYTLPFQGEWLVYNGGMTPKTSHSWDILGQRFAIDFVVADADLHRHTGRGTRTEDYRCYGRAILTAADGVVVATQDGIGPAPLLGWGVCDFTARSFIGNHVIVEHAPGEFALYAHLIAGSLTVKPGDRVGRGQAIGRCGNTGHSSEPHLHFHLQDSPDVFTGMGLPVRFTRLAVDGQAIDAAYLTAGQRVVNA